MLSKKTRKILLQTGIAISISFTSIGWGGTVSGTVVAEATVVSTASGTVTVKAASLWAYSAPSWTAKSRTFSQGTVLQAVAKHEVEGRYMYRLSDGLYITADTTYVTFVPSTTSTAVVSPAVDTRVTTANVNLRSGAGTNFSLLLTIPKGTTLTVQSVSGTWAKVGYGGKTGYVTTAYLTSVQAPAPAPAPAPTPVVSPAVDTRVTTANVNLRSGAGTNYSLLLTIPKGTTLTVQSVSGTWAKVGYGGKTGYVTTAYLASVQAPAPAPAPAPTPVVSPAVDTRVTTTNLNLRSGAGTNYSLLLTIPKGTTLTVQSVSGTWAKVGYGGKTGYVSTAYLTKAAEPTPPPVVEPAPALKETKVTTVSLNMRTGPATTFAILATIPKGTNVVVLEESGGWSKVEYGGKTGYAASPYLQAAPTVETPQVLPSLMTVDTQLKASYKKEDINIRGWALSSSGIKEVRIFLDGKDLGVAAGEARPDVLEAYPKYTATPVPGFNFTLLKGQLAPGPHTVVVKAVSQDGSATTSTHQFTELVDAPKVIIEKPSGSYEDEDVEVSGYVLDNAGVKSVTVSVNGILVGSAETGIMRTDVANLFPDYTNAATSGFLVPVAKDRFVGGTNTVTVKSTGNDGVVTTASVTITMDKTVLALKSVLESPTVSAFRNEDILVKGYALNNAGVKSVKVLLNGKPTGTARIGISRPDIATANPAYANAATSGFEYLVRRNTLFPGSNVLTVTVTANDGTVKTFTRNITVDKIPLIIVDAGHGGTDSGATGYLMGMKVFEKTFVLQYAHLLDAELKALGYRTLMTRTNDTFIGLSTRADIANKAHADLFFSFHHDASSDPNSQGAFLIYPSQKLAAVSESSIKESIDVATKLKTVFVNAGFKSRNNGYDINISGHTLAVLRQSDMRSVLSEIGYMTNAQDIVRLADPVMQKAIAYGLAQEIRAYFERR